MPKKPTNKNVPAKTKKGSKPKPNPSTAAAEEKATRIAKTASAEKPVRKPDPAAIVMPAVSVAPPTANPRLPPVGTLLQKRDRHGAVRCECTVEDGGVRYAGKLYRSLSSAAMAAAKGLGLNNKTQNGFIFWGVTKPPRRSSDPLEALDRVWERYHGNVAALVKEGVTEENRSKVVATIRKHAQAIENLRAKVA